MFYSENLLSKEGPLAQVWLAANLERKLNKSQFLQSNITQSTQAIVKATNDNNGDDSEALALRLSGQLLYGVVRIYSRKAKYLLDDVNDALLKLKTAFKSSVNSVTLPVNATIVPSVNQLMLQDTITYTDLLYQEPLVFDDEPLTSASGFFGPSQGGFANRSSQDFDDSIEIPRNKFNDMDELQEDDGFDLDLNFDIDEDRVELPHSESSGFGHVTGDDSVEMGRAIDDGFNLSAIDNIEEEEERMDGFDDLGFDEDKDNADEFFNQPLELIDELTNEENAKEPAPPQSKPKSPRKPRVSTAGQRKLVVDSSIEIPINNFSNTNSITSRNSSSTKQLDPSNKRKFIQTILRDNFNYNDPLASTPSKRQKASPTTNSVESDFELPELVHSDLDQQQGDFQEEDRYDSIDFGAWDEDQDRVNIHQEQLLQQQEEEEEEEDFASSFGKSKDGISESTLQISRHIQTIITSKSENSKTTFSEVLENDVQSTSPLCQKPRAEATRVFFELLVLSTNDALKLKQDQLFGEIQIETRENLFQRFV